MFFLATNGWDVLTFGVPSALAAATGLLAAIWSHNARAEARTAKEQTASPNGITTGTSVDQIRRDLVDLRANQAEFKESVRASRILTAQVRTELRETREQIADQMQAMHAEQVQHITDDNDRFEALFEKLNGDDE